MKDNNTLSAVALIAGLAVGAALGVLFAPRKGKEIRNQVAEGAEDVFSRIKSKFTAAKENIEASGNQAIEDLREHVRQVAEDLQGPEGKRKDPTAIKVPSAGTTAWKTQTAEEA